MTERIETNSGLVEIRIVECRYDSGLVEIAYYLPELLHGAGGILSVVVSRQGPNCRWAAYAHNGGKTLFRARKDAEAFALQRAMDHEATLAYLRKPNRQTEEV